MSRAIDLASCRRELRDRRALDAAGWTERDIREGVADGRLLRLQRNRYIDGAVWDELWPEGRHLVHVAAAAAEMTTGSAVFSHASAAVLHSLPLYRYSPSAVHVTVRAGGGMPSRAGLLRHRDAIEDADVVEVHGIRCTSLMRTVCDTGRTAPPEAGIAAADAALRAVAFVGERYDERRAAQWCAEALAREAARAGARGVRRAREILALADGRAESPGESVSRWRWVKAGFAGVVVQPVIRLADGRLRRADLAIEQVRCLFEFDGRVKYDDPAMRSGRTAEDVVFDEKLREDELRAATGWRVIRAVDADIATPEAFSALLSRYRLI